MPRTYSRVEGIGNTGKGCPVKTRQFFRAYRECRLVRLGEAAMLSMTPTCSVRSRICGDKTSRKSHSLEPHPRAPVALLSHVLPCRDARVQQGATLHWNGGASRNVT